MEKIIGLIDAPFTPFYENGEVNYEPIPAYAAMLQKNGLQGVFINGSSGAAATQVSANFIRSSSVSM